MMPTKIMITEHDMNPLFVKFILRHGYIAKDCVAVHLHIYFPIVNNNSHTIFFGRGK